MKTVKCPKCPKTFSKASQTSARQALRCHVMRVHDKTMVPNGIKKRAPWGSKRKQQTVENLHFCPRCGLNLQTLAVAMLVAERER